MLVKGIPELKPIKKDEKRTDRQYFCVGCGGAATQTAFFKIEGAPYNEQLIICTVKDSYFLK